MSVYLSYVLLGLSLSAPIGPINAAQLDSGIRRGFLHAWLVGLGAMIADAVYMVMVYMGIVHFIEIPFMKSFLWLFGCFVLVYTGIESLAGASSLKKDADVEERTKLRSFLSGFLMSLSNPMTILFWLGIYGSVLADTAARFGREQVALYSLAIIGGILLWDITMAGIASTFRKWLTDGLLRMIAILSGLSLIGFGAYFGFQAIRMFVG